MFKFTKDVYRISFIDASLLNKDNKINMRGIRRTKAKFISN